MRHRLKRAEADVEALRARCDDPITWRGCGGEILGRNVAVPGGERGGPALARFQALEDTRPSCCFTLQNTSSGAASVAAGRRPRPSARPTPRRAQHRAAASGRLSCRRPPPSSSGRPRPQDAPEFADAPSSALAARPSRPENSREASMCRDVPRRFEDLQRRRSPCPLALAARARTACRGAPPRARQSAPSLRTRRRPWYVVRTVGARDLELQARVRALPRPRGPGRLRCLRRLEAR